MFGSMPAGMVFSCCFCSLSLSPSISRSVSPCPILARILRLLLQQMWIGKREGKQAAGHGSWLSTASRGVKSQDLTRRSSIRVECLVAASTHLRETMRELDTAIAWQLEKGL